MSGYSYNARTITRDAASKLIAQTLAASKRVGFEPAIVIVDPAGNLKAFERSDGSSFLAANIAIDKAYTAASFGLATHQWVEILED